MSKYREHMEQVRRDRILAHQETVARQQEINAAAEAETTGAVRLLDQRATEGRLDGKAYTPTAENKALRGPAENKGAEIDATDAAVELAEAEGVDLRRVKGTGSGGRILKSDVEKALG